MQYLSATQAAEYLGITRQALHNLTKTGQVGTRIGHAWVFTEAELDAWVNKPRPNGGRPPKKSHAGTLPAVSPA